MQFLTPATIAIAAALTIPPLIALYFLKLKRRIAPISSTLLWKRAVEDLHVNAPFQRLRSSLLLLLQLLILILGALALGQPMSERAQRREQTLILMIDQSASMSVLEVPNTTRLDIAKREAKRVIDRMDRTARAMIIAFSDRATVVSSFDADRSALKARIDTIEQTDSLSTITEALSLAEAYSQNLIIAGSSAGTDVAPQSAAPAASVILFTDGKIEDAAEATPQRLDTSKMEVVRIGQRSDNVGIIAMEARRNYEKPEAVAVFATVRNFGDQPITCDATLLINNEHIDVQTIKLAPGLARSRDREGAAGAPEGASPDIDANAPPPPGSIAAVAFDEVEFGGEGVVEVRLSIDDSLQADNNAWTIIQPPRRVDVLLVTEGNFFLEKLLPYLRITYEQMTPGEYESTDDEKLIDMGRSRFDVVILDGHSTARLPLGNYLFFGAAPEIEGVEQTGRVDDQVIIDWKDTHPILRHVAVENINVFNYWLRLKLPGDAVRLIEGETDDATVLSYLTRGGSQFLICALGLIVYDDIDGQPMENSDWCRKPHFPVFVYNAIQYLSSSLHTTGAATIRPGEPKSVPIPPNTRSVTVKMPNAQRDTIPTGAAPNVTFARTRRVGVYEVEPAIEGEGTFAVNLFSPNESAVRPAEVVVVSGTAVAGTRGRARVNEPIWSWFVLAILLVLLLEWVVYNKRVYV